MPQHVSLLSPLDFIAAFHTCFRHLTLQMMMEPEAHLLLKKQRLSGNKAARKEARSAWPPQPVPQQHNRKGKAEADKPHRVQVVSSVARLFAMPHLSPQITLDAQTTQQLPHIFPVCTYSVFLHSCTIGGLFLPF